MTDVIKQCDVVETCVDCPRYGDDCDGDKRIEHTDLISRADAIEAVRGLSVLVDDKDYSYFEDALKALPSAEAEWIPCSERLPNEDVLYLVQTNYMYHGIPNMDVYYWADGWNCIRLLNGMVKREYEIDGIVAWIPLPKPYKAESEDEDDA